MNKPSLTPPSWRWGGALAALWPTLPAWFLKDMSGVVFKDPARTVAGKTDPLRYHGPTRLATALALKGAAEGISATLPDFHTPMLVMHGNADMLCPFSGSEALFLHGGSKDKPLVE